MNISFDQINLAHSRMRKCEQLIYKETGLKIVLNMSPVSAIALKPEEMMAVIALALGMKMEDYKSESKKTSVVALRHLTATFLRQYWPKISLKKIGSLFDQDHTTIMSALRTSASLLDNGDAVFTSKYITVRDAVEKWIKSNEKV